MKDIPDKSIDMILCDLPYGITKCKWDIILPFRYIVYLCANVEYMRERSNTLYLILKKYPFV